ncbi:hypothetical protein A7U60_g2667 [Sanghuangporus baumii]|uniref:Uncharacterized protein n=1 Tax=Sanghuangporus baumii TaxID=108892 RepID=A0A9Q5NAF9_SANBA|nr:hypothetical protein A7U60_g2667 [Sanghuangporus baumii]
MHAHNTIRSPNLIPIASSPSTYQGICGSLDPQTRSKKTKSGWRYIQLTDSQDELRVLLPPRPAAIYANMLKVEAYNLAKNPNDPETLREIQEIQYLKDVMVKRCQKLAEDTIRVYSATQGSRSVSVVEAPLDFKVQRLENWWERMEPRVKTKSHSSHSKRQAHAERRSRVQATNSTTTISPTKSRVHGAPVAPTNAVVETQFVAEAHTSPAAPKKRPAPLAVPQAGQTHSAQSSPLIPHAPRSPNVASRRASVQVASLQSSRATQQQQPSGYRPVYSNNQVASPMQTPYNPSFDPNQSLAVHQSHPTPATTQLGIPVSAYSPSATGSVDKQHIYGSADALAEAVPQADPSLLKDRFLATYMTSPSNSTSSPSSNGSKPPAHPPQNLAVGRENAVAYLHAGAGHATHTRLHSYSMPVPGTAGSSNSEKEHRRRATVDCDDTDRSVPRPKGYMYSANAVYTKNQDVSPESRHNENAYSMQGARNPDDDHSPSAVHRIARMYNYNLVPGGSPQSSTGSKGSPHLQGSPGASYFLESSLHSQNSPGKGAHQARGYGSNLTVDQAHAYSKGSNGSPTLLPPDPALSRSRRGSDDHDINASRQVLTPQVNSATGHAPRQLRRTDSRRDLRDPQPTGAGLVDRPVVPPPEYYAPQARSPRSGAIVALTGQQVPEAERYQRGRSRRSPRRHYDASPHRRDAVIPDMAALTPMGSNRNSRYTSGGSSVSEPVIPDVSLIIEADHIRNRGDRVRRRLVPFQSSSEEGGSRYASDFDPSDYSSSDDEDDDYYKRPYRPRDGYGSGYTTEAEGVKHRAPSRPQSRSPSRGILKRSSSVCSQRSSKSVRLEIPRDRRALEEVRDAEDKVDRVRKLLDDLQRRKGRTKTTDTEMQKATEALDEAKRSLKEKDDEYQAILSAMKLKRAEQNEPEARYV